MDAWWPPLVRVEFASAPGKAALARLEATIDIGTSAATRASAASGAPCP